MATYNEDLNDDFNFHDSFIHPLSVYDFVEESSSVLPQRVFLYNALDNIDEESSSFSSVVFSFNTQDGISISDEWISSAQYTLSVSDDISYSDGCTGLRICFFSTQDDVSFSEQTINSVIYNIRVNDIIKFGFVLDIMGIRYDAEIDTGDDYTPFQYDGFAFEANTFAASKYKGWNFNSFSKVGEKYYGCSSDGIYLLDGDTDNGELIKSVISTGNVKLSGGLQSRISKAYLIVKNNGKLIISVAGDDSRVYNYTLSKYNEYMDEARVDIGKGLKSVVWRFELCNVDGSNFEIDNLAVYPLILTNRRK